MILARRPVLQKELENQRVILLAELLAIAFMGSVAVAAVSTGVTLLLFPELAALSHDVLTRPYGKWAQQPLRLIATPTLTATAGLFVTRHTHYGAGSVLLIVLAIVVLAAVGGLAYLGLNPPNPVPKPVEKTLPNDKFQAH